MKVSDPSETLEHCIPFFLLTKDNPTWKPSNWILSKFLTNKFSRKIKPWLGLFNFGVNFIHCSLQYLSTFPNLCVECLDLTLCLTVSWDIRHPPPKKSSITVLNLLRRSCQSSCTPIYSKETPAKKKKTPLQNGRYLNFSSRQKVGGNFISIPWMEKLNHKWLSG